MTANQSPPARPDGDALADAIRDIESIHEKIGERGLLNLTASIQTLCRRAIDSIEAARATSQARDTAEGATGQYKFPYQRTFDAIAAATDVLSGPPNQKQLSISVRKFQAVFNQHQDAKPLAPPKPAPDAVRKATDTCPRCGSCAPHMHPAVQHEGEVELCTDEFHLRPTNQNTPKYIAAVEAKRALAAPVPPADGALDLGPQNKAFHAALRRYPDAFEALHYFWNEAFASATGATEPVAWTKILFLQIAFAEFKEHELRQIVEAISKNLPGATPPVRGDREAIQRIIMERSTLGGMASGAIADAILSLPVQPGAGERDWPQPFTTAPRDGTPILARCNDHSEMYALRWDGEHWACRDARTTFGDGLFLPNGDWCLDPFSRQPLQSSSDGGPRTPQENASE